MGRFEFILAAGLSAAFGAIGFVPSAQPQAAVRQQLQAVKQAGGWQQIGNTSAVPGLTITAAVGGVPGAGTYNLHPRPTGMNGIQLWSATLVSGAGGTQIIIHVWRRADGPAPVYWLGSIHQANFGPIYQDCTALFPLNGPDFSGSGSGAWSCGGAASIALQ